LKLNRAVLRFFVLLLCSIIQLAITSPVEAATYPIFSSHLFDAPALDPAALAVAPTPTPDLQLTSPASGVSPACLKTKGLVNTGALQSRLLPRPLEYRIYLPPCYDEQVQQRYPVLYLIHGQSYTDDQWDRLGADETADSLITAGEVGPFIIVMPRDRVWSQPDEDPFGQALTEELIPWIDRHYRTQADRRFRAIGGLSRGGGWALHLGLSRQDLFSAIGLHSAAIFSSDTQRLPQWLDKMLPDSPRIYIDIGEKDRPQILGSITRFEDYLTEHGIPHLWHLYTGYHEEAYWQSHVDEYLRWYAEGWKSGT